MLARPTCTYRHNIKLKEILPEPGPLIREVIIKKVIANWMYKRIIEHVDTIKLLIHVKIVTKQIIWQ